MKTTFKNFRHKSPLTNFFARLSKNLAIRHKLVMVIMLASAGALIIAGMIFTAYQWKSLRQFMVKNISAQAEIAADSCSSAVAFEDAESAKESLNSLRVESSIVFGGVYDKNSELIAAYYRQGTGKEVQPEFPLEDTYQFKDGYLTVYKRILLMGDNIGTVCIRSDLKPLKKMLANGIKIILTAIGVSLLVAFALSSKLQLLVSAPILNLAELAKAVSERRDYAVRGTKTSNDEIGLLIDAFNEMLDQIQQRDLALVEANKQLEFKVAERTADLENSVDKLNKSNKELREFTYIASHDLREPLRKISSFGQLLVASLMDELHDDDRENLQFMIDGANRMQSMVEALLAYSRVTTRGVEFEAVDVNQLIEELQKFSLAVLMEKSQGKINIPEPLHCINCDPTQVRQLLQNLVGNALKYHHKDKPPVVTVSSYLQNDGMVRIEISDNGIGIKEDYLKNVFVMFRRLNPKQKYEGTGIGLAICKKIVERHGGNIGVRSTYGKGSTFWFTIPAVGTRIEIVEPQEIGAQIEV